MVDVLRYTIALFQPLLTYMHANIHTHCSPQQFQRYLETSLALLIEASADKYVRCPNEQCNVPIELGGPSSATAAENAQFLRSEMGYGVRPLCCVDVLIVLMVMVYSNFNAGFICGLVRQVGRSTAHAGCTSSLPRQPLLVYAACASDISKST